MSIKVGINGFGRIGRVVLRILAEQPDKYEVCGINLRKADVDYMVYLLKYDSVFRRFNGTVEHEGGDLVVNGHKIKVYSESDAAMINWADCGAEYIIESTGANNTTEKASRHFKGGAKKVLLTAPAKDEVTPTFVYGVNSVLYQPDMMVVSNASCTTNCLAPIAKVLNDYIGNGQPWDLDKLHGGVHVLPPYQTNAGASWYEVTANAIYQNMSFIERYDPEYVIILGGDHIYKMDYSKMLQFHKQHQADSTIAVLDVPMEEASRFVIMTCDEEGRVVDFTEKPKEPKSTLASMGIYIFTWKKLKQYLIENENANSGSKDFGKDIIPAMLAAGERLFAYAFEGYW